MYDTQTDAMELAPVYDCGSCLYPQADEQIMEAVLADKKEQDYRIFEIPTSAIMVNEKKIKYFDFISSLQYEDCNKVLQRIVPKIDMNEIVKLINGTPFIGELQKEFFAKMLTLRKEKILDYSVTLLKERDKKSNMVSLG